jgi:hypothetical protein
MTTTFLEHAFFTLDKYLAVHRTVIIQHENKRVVKTALRIASKVITQASPSVTCVTFALDCCKLERGRSATFLLNRSNIVSVITPCAFANADDWSVYILHGMGEVMSICTFQTAIQITYMVQGRYTAPEKIYISIQYRGVPVFSSPVEICKAEFRNMGRLAFRAKLIDIHPNICVISDILPGGSVIAVQDVTLGKTRIYESVVDMETECADILYRLSTILTKLMFHKKQRFTDSRTIIGFSSAYQLAEVTFDDTIARTFPFVNVYSFDICEAADCMAVSYANCTDIVMARLSTGETLRTISHGKPYLNVNISPSGQFICASMFCFATIYSSMSGKLIKEMQMQVEGQSSRNVFQFLSDEVILVSEAMQIYDTRTLNRKLVNINTEEVCEFLPGVMIKANCVRGPYAYCLLGGKLCAYE